MNIEKSESSGITILTITGRVDSTNAGAFEEGLVPQVEKEDTGMVLDLGPLEYISSAGLRVILMAAKAAKKGGVHFAICALNDEIAELFSITGFDSIVAIEPTIEACLARFEAI